MITSIAGDCILGILSYLEEPDLFEMSYLSLRLFELVQLQLVKNRKQHPGELKIVESEYGHSFTLYDEHTDTHYAYTLRDCPWGGNPKEKRLKFSKEDERQHEEMLIFWKHYVTKFKPVPSLLLSNMDQLLPKHLFNGMTLYNILIDSSFLSYLEQNVHTLEYLNLWGVKVEEDCIERFTRFLMKFKPWEITITNSDSAFQALMNERFFEMYFLGNKWPKGCVIDFGFDDYYREKCRFYPSKRAALEYLSIYNSFEHLSIAIDPLWIPEIFERRLKNEERFFIEVTLTGMPTQWNFDDFPDLEFDEGNGANFGEGRTPSHAVMHAENGRKIHFTAYNEGNIIAFRATNYTSNIYN